MKNDSYLGIILHVDAGWSSLVARRAHNPKVVGSNPAPATKFLKRGSQLGGPFCTVDIGFLCNNRGDYALFYYLSCSVDIIWSENHAITIVSLYRSNGRLNHTEMMRVNEVIK